MGGYNNHIHNQAAAAFIVTGVGSRRVHKNNIVAQRGAGDVGRGVSRHTDRHTHKAPHSTLSSSTVKTSVALAGILGGDPLSP